MRCLLELLRGQGGPHTVDESEWASALNLAEEEHVLPWAVSCLRLQQPSLPPTILDRLDKIERDSAIAAFFWSSELKGVLSAFEESELRVIPLKGPLLAEQFYGSAALRVSRDLDLLVSRADLPRAESILSAIGFVPGTADDYHRPWRRKTTTVELHHNVENPLAFNFHVEDAVHRSHAADFHGERCWQLAPEDELLFLCLHAARHRFERLSLILDLQLAFERLPLSSGEWQPRPEVAELDPLLVLGLAMARRLHPGFVIPIGFPNSGRTDERLEKLADRQWNRLLAQSSEPLDWSAVHAFFLEIETPGWPRLHRRTRHLRILLGRTIDRDYDFAAQLGLHRPWQVRMVRPLRLFSERIRR